MVTPNVPVVLVEGGLVMPLTVRVNVWGTMLVALLFRPVKVIELSKEL